MAANDLNRALEQTQYQGQIQADQAARARMYAVQQSVGSTCPEELDVIRKRLADRRDVLVARMAQYAKEKAELERIEAMLAVGE